MESLLSYQSVEVSFHGCAVTHDVSFTLHSGEILGIVGERRPCDKRRYLV